MKDNLDQSLWGIAIYNGLFETLSTIERIENTMTTENIEDALPEHIEPCPGLPINTEKGICKLLYPERPGKKDENWVCLYDDGSSIIVTQEYIQNVER